MSRFDIRVDPMERVEVEAATRSFVLGVYAWMTLGLALTGGVAAYLSSRPDVLVKLVRSGFVVGCLIGDLVLVMVISWAINRISAGVATGLFLLYAATNGVLFGLVFLAYTATSVAATFFITAGTFGATCIYGYVTKTNLLQFRGVLFMGLIGLILASLVNLFLASATLSWIISYFGIAVFVGLTAYDTQKIKMIGETGLEGGMARKATILGALALYLDFINLFLLLLRLFGRRR